MRPPRPQIGKAPGLTWRPRKHLWEARWQARSDLVKRGYTVKSAGLWIGTCPDDTEAAWIIDRCNVLQSEMLAWSGAGDAIYKAATEYDGTLRGLSGVYQTDPDSPFHEVSYTTRTQRVDLLIRLEKEHGDKLITEIRPRDVKRWYEAWAADGKFAMGHSMITVLRVLLSFGAGILEIEECERLFAKLHHMKFKGAKARTVVLTPEMAIAIRKEAHRQGFPSIAKAQALQTDLMLRQKDVIGAWEPVSEPGVSDVLWNDKKWLRGLRGEEIDANLTLRHVTSKRGKPIEVPLSLAPMVMEEFADGFPAKGPLVICETTGRPWHNRAFSVRWRKIANAVGVPKEVRNMDSRAGAITEATEAGAELEHIKHAATHSDIAMTQRYSRGAAEKTAGVLIKRVEFRNKKPTG